MQNWTEIATVTGRDRSLAQPQEIPFSLSLAISATAGEGSQASVNPSPLRVPVATASEILWFHLPRERINIHCIFMSNLSVLIFSSNIENQPAAFKCLDGEKLGNIRLQRDATLRISAILNVSKEQGSSFSYAKANIDVCAKHRCIPMIYSIGPSSHAFQKIKDLASNK